MEYTPNAILIGLVSYALVGCIALAFSLWHIRVPTHMYPNNYTEVWIACGYCLQNQEGHILPSTVQVSQICTPWKCLPSCSIPNLSSLLNQVAMQGPLHHAP